MSQDVDYTVPHELRAMTDAEKDFLIALVRDHGWTRTKIAEVYGLDRGYVDTLVLGDSMFEGCP